jgi:hypothetical protein
VTGAGAGLEQDDRVVGRLLANLPQDVDVVHHVEPAPVRADHQVVVLHDDPMDRGHRQVEAERLPHVPIVKGHVDAGLGAEEQQPLALRILLDDASEVVRPHAGDDLGPRCAVVGRPVHVRRAIGALVAVGGDVRRAGVVGRRLDQADAREVRQARRRDLGPVLPAVPRHVHEAVVRAGPDHLPVDGRRRQGEDHGIGFDAGLVQRDRPARVPHRRGIVA